MVSRVGFNKRSSACFKVIPPPHPKTSILAVLVDVRHQGLEFVTFYQGEDLVAS
jgi:hypothetical protein